MIDHLLNLFFLFFYVSGNSYVISQSFERVVNFKKQFLPPAPIFNPSASYITNFSNPQQNFLDALSYYAASVPLKSFWLVQFQIPFLIQEQNLKGLSETFENNDFARADLGNNRFMKNIGCIFCRSFNFAGEVNSSAVPEMDIRGFRSVPYAGGRSSAIFQNLNLSFYESSISFIDFIIRPWIILMSYYSTIARNGDDPSNEVINGLKQDITCHLMTRTGVAKGNNRQSAQDLNANSDFAIPNYNFPWTYRKQITFKNCLIIDGCRDASGSSINNIFGKSISSIELYNAKDKDISTFSPDDKSLNFISTPLSLFISFNSNSASRCEFSGELIK
jgi:hypothetical protein